MACELIVPQDAGTWLLPPGTEPSPEPAGLLMSWWCLVVCPPEQRGPPHLAWLVGPPSTHMASPSLLSAESRPDSALRLQGPWELSARPQGAPRKASDSPCKVLVAAIPWDFVTLA